MLHSAMCVAVCCSVLQCVAVCCSVLRYVAVCCSALFSGALETCRILHAHIQSVRGGFCVCPQTNFPAVIYGASAISFGGKLWVIGGSSFNKYQATVISWDGSLWFKVRTFVFECGLVGGWEGGVEGGRGV